MNKKNKIQNFRQGDVIKLSRKLMKNIDELKKEVELLDFEKAVLESKLEKIKSNLWKKIYDENPGLFKYKCQFLYDSKTIKIIGEK